MQRNDSAIYHLRVDTWETVSRSLGRFNEFLLTANHNSETNSGEDCSSVAQPLPVPIFSGDRSEDHVYKFLERFADHYGNKLGPRDQADALFFLHISPEVKEEVAAWRKDLPSLKAELLKRYGQPNRIIKTERRMIQNIVQPEATIEDMTRYLTQLLARLHSIEDILARCSGTKPGTEPTILHPDFTASLRNTLPEALKRTVEYQLRTSMAQYATVDAGTGGRELGTEDS